MKSRPHELVQGGIWNLWLWIVLGIIFVAINFGNSSEPKSRYWFSELALYIPHALLACGPMRNSTYGRSYPSQRR